MPLFLLIVLACLWLFFALIGLSAWFTLFVLGILLTLYFAFPESNKLPAKPLIASKVILAFSFWGCIALALKNYQQTVTCLNCMRSYLNTHLQPNFESDFLSNLKAIWQNYTRLLTISGLLLLWSIVFIFIQHRKGKAK